MKGLGDETLRAVAEYRLAGYTINEIADTLKIKKRSVERKVTLIRSMWSQEVRVNE